MNEARKVDVFYNERNDMVTIEIAGHLFTVYAEQAVRLRDRINTEMMLAMNVADPKGD